MINPMSLHGKNILVTGASSGIGRAISVFCSKLGANVILVARNEDNLNKTISLLDQGNHLVLPYNLADMDHMETLFEAFADKGIKLDGLAYSAGIGPMTPVNSLTYSKMLEIFNVNYFAFIEMVKLYSKRKYSNGGSIVAVSSIASYAGLKGSSAYCGSKGALDSSIRALALEFASKKIRINSVVPSNIKTDMMDNAVNIIGEDLQEKMLAKQPLGLGECDDVANAAAFLLSEASRFITGTSLVVDGGYLSQ